MAAKRYRCTLTTSSAAATVEGEAIPLPTQDGRLRVLWGADDMGRGASVTIQPLDAGSQFVLHNIEVRCVPTMAGDDDA